MWSWITFSETKHIPKLEDNWKSQPLQQVFHKTMEDYWSKVNFWEGTYDKVEIHELN